MGEGLGVGARGLPIGNQTSQFWANVYLNSLDQFVTRELRCPGYVRYVDDFLLFAPDKRRLHVWRRAVIEYAATLRLTLHEPEAAVFPVATGIPFLGFRVYPDHRRLRRRNGIAFARHFRALAAEVAAGTIPVERLTAAVQGWVAHAAHADTYRLRASLLRRTPVPTYAPGAPARSATMSLQSPKGDFVAEGPPGANLFASLLRRTPMSPDAATVGHEVAHAAR